MQRNTILKIKFKCFRHPKECKIKYVVFLDLKSKLARIYSNEKGHNTDYFHGKYERVKKFTARVNIFHDFFFKFTFQRWNFYVYYIKQKWTSARMDTKIDENDIENNKDDENDDEDE